MENYLELAMSEMGGLRREYMSDYEHDSYDSLFEDAFLLGFENGVGRSEGKVTALQARVEELENIMVDAAEKTHNSKRLYEWYNGDYLKRQKERGSND